MTDMIPGHPFYIGSKLFLIPPLTMAQFKTHRLDREFIKDAVTGNGDLTDELLDIGTRLILAAAQRNYPDLTAEQLQDGISPSAMFAFVSYVLTPNMGQTVASIDDEDHQRTPGPLLYMSPEKPEVV